MVISSYNHPVECLGWNMEAGGRYVTSHSYFGMLCGGLKETDRLDWVRSSSAFDSYNKQYGGQDLNGKTLKIYRERGLGDNMMITAMVGWIKTLYPQANIHIHCQPAAADAWTYNPEASLFVAHPPTFDGLRMSDYHILCEGLFESDNEEDQPCAYDTYLRIAGFDPKTVPPEYKRPRLFFGPQDEVFSKEWQAAKPDKYILWQWSASATTRTYPPEVSEQAIRALAEHCDVVVTADRNNAIPLPNIEHPRVHQYVQLPSFRMLFQMIAGATAIVAPDSSVAHAAACWPDVPVFGLWGPFDPQDRVKYYPNHHAIRAFNACQFAPCRSQMNNLPHDKCATVPGYSGPEEKWCGAIKAIKPETIVDAVVKAIC